MEPHTFRMDYLPLAHVRTDPVLFPTCLASHVHTFYGVNASLRPETSYDDLRKAKGNSGNAEDNKSLYWHPTIYKYAQTTSENYFRFMIYALRYDPDSQTYTIADIGLTSAYYTFRRGITRAFPDGFQMITDGFNAKARARAECVEPSPCARSNCNAPSHAFFPETACVELEMEISFPHCWDGENNTSSNGKDHVVHAPNGGEDVLGDCPSSHPIELPKVEFFFRIFNYEGKQHCQCEILLLTFPMLLCRWCICVL